MLNVVNGGAWRSMKHAQGVEHMHMRANNYMLNCQQLSVICDKH